MVDMSKPVETILVRAGVELSPSALQSIVQHAKDMAGTDERMPYGKEEENRDNYL